MKYQPVSNLICIDFGQHVDDFDEENSINDCSSVGTFLFGFTELA